MVNQGDLLHGDANGVTNIPLEIAGEVADIAGEFLAAEEIVMKLRQSRPARSRRPSTTSCGRSFSRSRRR